MKDFCQLQPISKEPRKVTVSVFKAQFDYRPWWHVASKFSLYFGAEGIVDGLSKLMRCFQAL